MTPRLLDLAHRRCHELEGKLDAVLFSAEEREWEKASQLRVDHPSIGNRVAGSIVQGAKGAVVGGATGAGLTAAAGLLLRKRVPGKAIAIGGALGAKVGSQIGSLAGFVDPNAREAKRREMNAHVQSVLLSRPV